MEHVLKINVLGVPPEIVVPVHKLTFKVFLSNVVFFDFTLPCVVYDVKFSYHSFHSQV